MNIELTSEEAATVMSALEEKAYNDSEGERLEELLDLAFRKFELPDMLQEYQHTGDPAGAMLVEDEVFEVEDVVDAEHNDNGFAFVDSITVYTDVDNIVEMHHAVVKVASRVLPLGWTVKDYNESNLVIVPNKCQESEITCSNRKL